MDKLDVADKLDRNFARIRIDSYSSLPIEKVLTFHNLIILIKSVVNEQKINHYYFKKKGLYKDKCSTVLFFDIIDISEGIDDNKTSASNVCDICHYWYFLNISFKFQPVICDRCHDLFMNLSNISILNIKGY